MQLRATRSIAVLAVSAVISIAGPAVYGDDAAPATQPATQPVAVELCPVSGEPIGSMGDGYTIDYEGRSITFCCEGCESAFREDPENYLKKLDEKATEKKPADEKAHGGKDKEKADHHKHAH